MESITEKSSENQSQDWQRSLANAIRDTDTLLKALKLDPNKLKYRPKNFPLRVPQSYIDKMQQGNWNDPLLLQVLPLEIEKKAAKNYSLNPVGDIEASQNNGILHKYHGRALIITTGNCPIHCRYCFRQHFPYTKHQLKRNEWSETIDTLKKDTSIHEAILSGGDPLSLSDARLQSLCEQLDAIPHIKILRIHSRFPLVLPERIDSDFIAWLSTLSLQTIMVIHANHTNEFCKRTTNALSRLHQADVLLLNQSVLLKGVNDDSSTLATLSHTLIKHHVMPYYLHQLDRVQGAAHFEVEDSIATTLMDELRVLLPGYLVPKLVREIAGKQSKTPIF